MRKRKPMQLNPHSWQQSEKCGLTDFVTSASWQNHKQCPVNPFVGKSCFGWECQSFNSFNSLKTGQHISRAFKETARVSRVSRAHSSTEFQNHWVCVTSPVHMDVKAGISNLSCMEVQACQQFQQFQEMATHFKIVSRDRKNFKSPKSRFQEGFVRHDWTQVCWMSQHNFSQCSQKVSELFFSLPNPEFVHVMDVPCSPNEDNPHVVNMMESQWTLQLTGMESGVRIWTTKKQFPLQLIQCNALSSCSAALLCTQLVCSCSNQF